MLTIIIPYYRTYEYTEKLLERLIPQLTEEVEVIVIDDGCNEKRLDKYPIRVIHLEENSGGAAVPRNIGIEESKGEYIAFIDADDMVSEDYVKEILKKCRERWDYFYIGWTSKWGDVYIDDRPEYWNTCCWNCVYKRTIIKDERFPQLKIGEDKEFVKKVRKGTHSSIHKILYEYNTEVEGSLTWGSK